MGTVTEFRVHSDVGHQSDILNLVPSAGNSVCMDIMERKERGPSRLCSVVVVCIVRSRRLDLAQVSVGTFHWIRRRTSFNPV